MKRSSTQFRVHFIRLAAIIAVFTAWTANIQAQCTCTGNLVQNPSFENGTANWNTGGGNLSTGTGAVICGSYSGDFFITNNASNWVSQTIGTNLAIGTVLNASVYAGVHNNSLWHEVSIQFYDANWNWISSVWVEVDKVLAAAPGGPQRYTWTAIVPMGAKYTNVSFSGGGDWVKTDNWCVTVASPNLVSLGNHVFIDRNGNGKKDANDWGYDGATVKLYADNNDDGVADGPAVATTTTHGDGQYSFANLAPGKYFVQMENVPYWAFMSPVNGGDPDNNIDNDNNGSTQNTTTGIIKGQTITLTAGAEPGNISYNGTYDFGIFKTNGLGDFVFLDNNANGIQDAGENGISGVTVNLRSTSGTLLESTTTDANGYYAFYDPAQYGTYNYNIEFVAPAGYTASPANQGSDDNRDSDPVGGTITNVQVPNGTWNRSFDAGFYQMLSLGDRVFNDLNNNGVRDAAEVGIANVAVRLYADNNNDNVADGAALASATTNGTGNYRFDNLRPGNYIVGVVPPTGMASSSMTGVDPDNNTDVDDNGNNTLVAGEIRGNAITLSFGSEPLESGLYNNTYDFGFYVPASISNFVWHDLNKNGLQDAGEPGLSNRAVLLRNSGGALVASQVTNANGEYYFGSLAPGTYTLEFTSIGGMQRALHNVGSNQNINSKANHVTGIATVTVAAGENNTTMDAGYQTVSLLPVQDIVLTPKVTGSTVEVHWQTLNEINTSHFEVERSYSNGQFERVGTIYSLVQNGGNGSYRMADNGVQMSAPNVVYRIKAVDKDGAVSYSRTASLKLGKLTNIVYGPNPFMDYLTINYPALANDKVNVAIFDMSGKKLMDKEFSVSRGTSSLTINNLGTLAKGAYTVQVVELGTGNSATFKMVK
jgi:protocatechuate 3,4-dioxygenase beta subunit